MESKIFEQSKGYKNFSKKQKDIYNYVVKNPHSISMMSAAQLSAAANVGEATLFRFLKQLGYETYSDFKVDVHAYALEEMNSNYWQLRTKLESDKTYKENGPASTMNRSIDILKKTISPNVLHMINQVVELMLDAPQIAILGIRSSKAVALYFEYILLPFIPKISQLSHDESYIYERLLQLEKGSIVFLIAGWPNTKSVTKAAQYCAEAGIKTILLTNNETSSVAAMTDFVIATLKPKNYYSIVPFVAILEAIAVEIALRLSPITEDQLKRIDEILATYGITDYNESG